MVIFDTYEHDDNMMMMLVERERLRDNWRAVFVLLGNSKKWVQGFFSLDK